MRFDRFYRQLYSTDASCYRVEPSGVVLPRHAEDVIAVVEAADRFGAALVPRGSGSALAGQAVGPGVVVDTTRWLDQILAIDPPGRRAQVQAGVILDSLNAALLPYGLMVGPNPASSAVATLGGMAANNSTGSHSIEYGLTIDHLLEAEVVLSDGTRCILGPKTPAEVAFLAQQPGLEGELYRQVPRLVAEYRQDIATGYPQTWRNVAGYPLDRLLASLEAGRPLNLAQLLAGSEGTLAFILSLWINLVPRPRFTRLAVLHFDQLQTALEQVPWILEHRPSAVELLDHVLLRQARLHPAFGPRVERFTVGDPQALLVVEFSGDNPEELKARALELERRSRRQGQHGPLVHCATPEDVENVWSVRRDVNGLIRSRPSDDIPLSFVDDAAVPVERLPAYVSEVQAACRAAGVEVNFDAHASAGCLHMNPAINLKKPEGLERMRAISQAVMEIAIRHHGTTTGEHGDGLARSYYVEQLYGPRLYEAFRRLKGIFDPHNRLNPGKIVDGCLPWQPEVLRFNPQYRLPFAPRQTYFDFSPYAGFAGLAEMCNGQGVCRSLGPGVMCPSFRATRDEQHATRGRANALRLAMAGDLGAEGLSSRDLYEALDLCLECKACKHECSSRVDMARLKAEYLAQYQDRHGVPLRSRLFAHVAALYRLGSLAPWLANAVLRSALFRNLLDRYLGVDRRRALPAAAPRTFQAWFRRRPKPASAPRGPVILWDDTYLSYNEPEVGMAAVRVLEAAGFEVRLVKDRVCCGRPMISKGLLGEARRHAAHNLARLAPLAAQGFPIVGIEPSCIATFRDEYPALVPGEEARLVAGQSFFVEEFLADLQRQGTLRLPFKDGQERRILAHGHCYQKALTAPSALVDMLRLVPGALVEEIPSGCCGMAGAFGYEKEHYDLSLKCAEDRLLPAVRAADPQTVIVAAGVSCRKQILDGAGRVALHPVQVLAEALE